MQAEKVVTVELVKEDLWSAIYNCRYNKLIFRPVYAQDGNSGRPRIFARGSAFSYLSFPSVKRLPAAMKPPAIFTEGWGGFPGEFLKSLITVDEFSCTQEEILVILRC